MLKRSYVVTLIILLVLVLDQALKVYIKTHFCANDEILIAGQKWARLHFVENEGMAFGITFGWEYGKLVLSLFRIIMVAALIWYIRLLLEAGVSRGFLYSIGLITAGALGNIIDSAFYGLIFTNSPVHDCELAQLVPIGQGYGSFLHGKVVDMFFFPITWIHMPGWVPGLGGESFLFFSPIFNLADASITCGVLAILLFQRRFFKHVQPEEAKGKGQEAIGIEPAMVQEGEEPSANAPLTEGEIETIAGTDESAPLEGEEETKA